MSTSESYSVTKEGRLGMHITIKLVGISPLLLNKFTDAAAQASTAGSRGSSAGADRGTPIEQAKARLYVGVNGELMIPQPNLLRSLVEGGRFHKIGKKQVTTANESMLYAAVDIQAAEIPLLFDEPWSVDTRAVVIPATRGRILVHRPVFANWSLEFELTLDTTIVGARLFRLIVDDAGRRVGLGDFRPARKGPYGRYRVDQWQEFEESRELEKLAAE